MSDDLNPAPGWASNLGLVSFPEEQVDLSVLSEQDWREIHDALGRYGWAYDERQLAAVANGFTKDCVWEGSVAGNFTIDPIVGREAITEWLAGIMETQTDQRRHNTMNVNVTAATPDSATLISYLLLTKAENGVVSLATTATYETTFVKEDGAWRIKHFRAGFDAPF